MRGTIFHKYANVLLLHQPQMGLWFMALTQLVKKLFNVEAQKCSKLPWFTVTFIFKFDPRKDQFQIKLGQISKFKFFLQNMPFLSSFVSGLQKCIYFFGRQKCQRLHFKKWCYHLCLFLPLHRQIWRYCFEIWLVCVLIVCSFAACIPFVW